MKCEEIEDLMLDVAAGAGEARSVLDEHVRDCSSCAAKLAGLRKTMALLDEWQAPEPSPYFDTRLAARMREERAKPEREAWPAAFVSSREGTRRLRSPRRRRPQGPRWATCKRSTRTKICTRILICWTICRCSRMSMRTRRRRRRIEAVSAGEPKNGQEKVQDGSSRSRAHSIGQRAVCSGIWTAARRATAARAATDEPPRSAPSAAAGTAVAAGESAGRASLRRTPAGGGRLSSKSRAESGCFLAESAGTSASPGGGRSTRRDGSTRSAGVRTGGTQASSSRTIPPGGPRLRANRAANRTTLGKRCATKRAPGGVCRTRAGSPAPATSRRASAGSAPPAGGRAEARRRLAALAPEPVAGGAAEGAAERSAVPQASSAATAAAGEPFAEVQQPVSGRATAPVEPDRDLGAPHAAAKDAGPGIGPAVEAVDARPPANDEDGHRRSARHARGATRERARVGPLQGHVHRAGAEHAARDDQASAGAGSATAPAGIGGRSPVPSPPGHPPWKIKKARRGDQLRSRFFARKNTFAGRSARRRMK